ncbi:MAG: methyltransferase domain-containing protein [Labilithrix sp.]|nr:methyltransferase domain-containing protein [Labilithrix sp.]MCW5810323.1 methyltransferase domain-containing protein [Labilithrix sp.]
MDLKEQHDNHSRHPWELSRFDFFARCLETSRPSKPHTILDVGAGDAWFSKRLLGQLPDDARVTCWDSGYERLGASAAARLATSRIELVHEQPGGTFDVVLMLDVLEHVPDDVEFLRSIVARNMSATSTLLLSVPAWQSLRSSHDLALEHCRRYSPATATSVLESAGLHIRASGGLFHSFLAPRALQVLKERVFPPAPGGERPSSEWRGGPALTAAIHAALRIDNRLSRWSSLAKLDVPGLSWWAVCERA